MTSETKRKILLKDGSDNDFVVESSIDFKGEPFAKGKHTFPDYQSARMYYDDLISWLPHDNHHDYIKEDLEKAIAEVKDEEV